jgi:hypothetical protein
MRARFPKRRRPDWLWQVEQVNFPPAPRKIIDAAQIHARSLEIAVTVAVVDEGGLVKAIDLSGREVWLIRRVPEVLGLERAGSALAVDVAADAGQHAREKVARIQVDSRLIGPDGQFTAAHRVEGTGRQVETVGSGCGWLLGVQQPVV